MFPVINANGKLLAKNELFFGFDHPAVSKGLIIQEMIRLLNGKFLFAEDHYFHLMANMRMARMKIPMTWTPEFFYLQLELLQTESALKNAGFTYNVSENFHQTDFWIFAVALTDEFHKTGHCEIEHFRDSYISSAFHYGINFPEPESRIFKIFAEENGFQDLLFVNSNKSVARSMRGNIFIIQDGELKSPSLDRGARNDVLRSKILSVAGRMPHFNEVKEEEIFPFSLMKAEEAFVAVDGEGIHSVTKFRKKQFSTETTSFLAEYLLEQH